MENIIRILMKRDGITKREAQSMLNSCKKLLFKAVETGNYSEAEEIIMSELGLEPDYIIDIIDSEVNTPKSKGGKKMKKDDIVKTVPTLKPVADVLEKKSKTKKEDTTMKKTQPPKIQLTPAGKKIVENSKKEETKMKKNTSATETTKVKVGDSIYYLVEDEDDLVVEATISKIMKSAVILSYEVEDEEFEKRLTLKAFEAVVSDQSDLKRMYEEQEEELDDEPEDDDDTDWDEILEGVSVNNLRAICKKLKVPMSEIKGRSKADLISIIIDSHDDDEIQKAYDSVGATTNEEEKKKPLSTGSDEGKKNNKRYWENETPIESNTDGNIVNYYEEAGKLQLFGKYEKNGEFFKTKGVTIDVGVMSSKDAMQMISMMCYAMKDAVEDDRVKEIVEKLELINQEYNTEQYLFTKPEELAPFDEKTLERMALNCGCDINAKRKGAVAKKKGATRKDDLIKMIIDKTTELNG